MPAKNERVRPGPVSLCRKMVNGVAFTEREIMVKMEPETETTSSRDDGPKFRRVEEGPLGT